MSATDPKHTPGPWHISATRTGDGGQVVVAKNSVDPSVAIVASWEPHGKHNAYLIAAAPELLQSLKDAVKLIDELSTVGSHQAHPQTVRRFEDIIDKAEGS